ncbi:hypothetical protein CVT26_012623 [Gymnopilus dilepis]|uniref:Uncharacterized protein n=1 Tax=Gymnopilus dilepis TaxID=231916 RepID=A0A409XDG9_9AGAR|nr:hypothetical protein CVT26_012623 [Gymnopilus dilepis]
MNNNLTNNTTVPTPDIPRIAEGTPVTVKYNLPGTVEKAIVLNDPLSKDNREPLIIPKGDILEVDKVLPAAPLPQTPTGMNFLCDHQYQLRKKIQNRHYELRVINRERPGVYHPVPHTILSRKRPPRQPPVEALVEERNKFDRGEFAYVIRPWTMAGQSLKYGQLIFIDGEPSAIRSTKNFAAFNSSYKYCLVDVTREDATWLAAVTLAGGSLET